MPTYGKKPMKSKSTFFKIVLKILILTQMKASFMGEGGGGGWVLTVPQIPLFIREVLFFVSGVFFRGGGWVGPMYTAFDKCSEFQISKFYRE